MNDVPTSRIKKAVDFTTSNFALVSASAFILAIISSAMFTTGYLGVFNRGLIWIVEYTDLVKISLVITLFLTGFFWFIDSYLSGVLFLFDENATRKSKIINSAVLLTLVSISFVILLYVDYLSGKPRIVERIAQALAVFLFVALLFRIKQLQTSKTFPPFEKIFSDIGILLVFLTTCGALFGFYTKNTPSLKETIYLDDRILYDGVLVLFTSSYAVFYTSDNAVLVVPASRVREIRSKSSL
ncbi:hypothetical protein NKJ74_14245 [Mesorhizobium sp. M0046]|uniref:hypothetical protein n=1 Tax=Mesorhizobium sp. M0046 TaxID=2956858 RepID=UPI00333916CD